MDTTENITNSQEKEIENNTHKTEFNKNLDEELNLLPRENKKDNRKRKFSINRSDKKKKQKMFEVGKRLSEVDIGATEFISDYEGFSGIVKDRFSDFHVHEISMNGSIAKLTSFEILNMEQVEDIEELKKKLPENIRIKIQNFLENTEETKKIEIDVTDLDKDVRKNIHYIFKSVPDVISETKEINNRKMLIISKNCFKYRKSFGSRNREDKRINWSLCNGDYLHFILHKVNMDTMDALNQLASYLRIKASCLNCAGTKDRRAKTTQWISWKRGNPYLLEKAGRAIKGAYVGNFKFSKIPLKLGLLKGNQFTIALRNVTANDETINLAMTSLRDNGFINYFGLQRFGSIASIPTYEIGKALLQENWQEAVNLILKPREEEQDENLAKARQIYEETKDAMMAFKKIERSDKIEAKLLRGIHICSTSNLQGALDHIPKNTLLMYIHSYQSLLWNIVVSRRIRDFGKKPIVGDLVYKNKTFKEVETQESNENDQDTKVAVQINCETINQAQKKSNEEMQIDIIESLKVNVEKNDELLNDKNNIMKIETQVENDEGKEEQKIDDDSPGNLEMSIKNDEIKKENDTELKIKNKSQANNGKEENEFKNSKKDENNADKQEFSRKLPEVKILTEEDLPNYTLADILMPMPGYKVSYPPYAKLWYDELLEKDGLCTNLKNTNRKYALSGSYRTIIKQPFDLSWRIAHYDDRNADVIRSDIDEMRNIESPKDIPDGKYKALIIKMSLPSSTYATCALREILKQDMSCQTQAAKSAVHI